MSSMGVCEQGIVPVSWRNKLFADLLQSVHLRGTVNFCPKLGAPWGFSIAGHGCVFHIVVEGKCLIELANLPDPVELVAGDFVVVPRGDAHTMHDSPTSGAVDFFELAKHSGPDRARAFRAGGKGAVTKLVCGSMQFENGAIDPLLAILPSLIHVQRKKRKGDAWLQATVSQVLEELKSSQPGAESVVTRLADILFIKAVRRYFEQNSDSAEVGWLAAIRDPQIGPALALLHTRTQEDWTVASLAHRVGLSRSLFAERFTQLVGEPPLRYLKRLRLNAAAIRLRSSRDKLSAIAVDSGYESAAAFTKAFKRSLGRTPGDYRRRYEQL